MVDVGNFLDKCWNVINIDILWCIVCQVYNDGGIGCVVFVC